MKYFKDMNSEERKFFYMGSSYVVDLVKRNPSDFHYKKAIEANLKYNETYKDKEGVVRWVSNGRVPPRDLLLLWKFKRKRFDIDLCLHVLNVEMSNSIACYKKASSNISREYEEERMRTLRGAFGEGEVVVDVLTGKRIRT